MANVPSPTSSRTHSLIAASVLVASLTTSGCAVNNIQVPWSSPTPTPTSLASVKSDLVSNVSTASYVDEKRGIKTEVPRFGSANNLTQAVDIIRHKDMREAHLDGATKVAVTSSVIAASPDVLGVAITSSTEGPAKKTTPATLWYDARRGQTYSSPILIEPAQWKAFADQVRAGAGTSAADANAVDEALVATPAPYGNGPAMGFSRNGDLVLQFASGVLGSKSKDIVLPSAEVSERLSEFGILAQRASTQPSAFTGTPTQQLPGFTAGKHRPAKSASPNLPTDGKESAEIPTPTPGGAVRPSTAVGVDCVVNHCVALTYDDGPSLDTPKLLKALDQARVPATFFQLGTNIKAHPDLVKQVASSGQEIGNHSLTHPPLARQSPARVKQEVVGNSERLAEIIGAKPLLFRPPYGSHNAAVDEVVRSEGMSIIQWNVDSNDWRSKNSDATQQEVMAGALKLSEPIVLMHDIHPTTIAAAPQILAQLKQNKMTLVTVSELTINTGGLQPGHAYCNGTSIAQEGYACKG